MGACVITMEYPISLLAASFVLFTAYQIFSNARRIQKRFLLTETVRLDDLTNYPPVTLPLHDNKKEEAYLAALPLLNNNNSTMANSSSSQYSILTGRNRSKVEMV